MRGRLIICTLRGNSSWTCPQTDSGRAGNEELAEPLQTTRLAVNRREIVTPDRRQILTPYSRCLKRQESFPVSMISQ